MIDTQMSAYLGRVLTDPRREVPTGPRGARQVILEVRRRAARARR